MTLLLAAVGAVVTALLELTVGTNLRVEGVTPHLLLVFGVVVVVTVGFDAGIVWAFVGGLGIDVLAQRPLGSSAFALLLCVAAASVSARSLPRLRPLAPIIAVALVSVLYSMVLFVTFGALSTPLPVSDPLGEALPAAAYDAVLAALIGPLAVAVHDRRSEQERVEW